MVLHSFSVLNQLITLLRKLYARSNWAVEIGITLRDFFEAEIRSRQRDPISPSAFVKLSERVTQATEFEMTARLGLKTQWFKTQTKNKTYSLKTQTKNKTHSLKTQTKNKTHSLKTQTKTPRLTASRPRLRPRLRASWPRLRPKLRASRPRFSHSRKQWIDIMYNAHYTLFIVQHSSLWHK